MNKLESVWVLEAGEYEDNVVVAVFSSKELGEKHKHLYPGTNDELIYVALDVEYPDIPEDHAIYQYTHIRFMSGIIYEDAVKKDPQITTHIENAKTNVVQITWNEQHAWLFAKSRDDAIEKGKEILAARKQ